MSAFVTGIGASLQAGDHFSMFVTPGTSASQINTALQKSADVSLVTVDDTGLAEFSWNSAPTDTSTAIAEVTGALGSASGSGEGIIPASGSIGSPSGGIGSLNMGAFINSFGNSVSTFFKNLGITGLSILEYLLLALVLIVILYVALASVGKGIGEGLATQS